jgi:hypothetical protein
MFKLLMLLSALVFTAFVFATLVFTNSVWADDIKKDCVYARDIQQFEVLDEGTLLLHGKFDRLWVNRLHTRCAGLRKNMIISVSRFGSQICANDRITATDRGAVSGEGPVASCRLGEFEAVDTEQLAALRASLAEKRSHAES